MIHTGFYWKECDWPGIRQILCEENQFYGNKHPATSGFLGKMWSSIIGVRFSSSPSLLTLIFFKKIGHYFRLGVSGSFTVISVLTDMFVLKISVTRSSIRIQILLQDSFKNTQLSKAVNKFISTKSKRSWHVQIPGVENQLLLLQFSRKLDSHENIELLKNSTKQIELKWKYFTVATRTQIYKQMLFQKE